MNNNGCNNIKKKKMLLLLIIIIIMYNIIIMALLVGAPALRELRGPQRVRVVLDAGRVGRVAEMGPVARDVADLARLHAGLAVLDVERAM